MYPKVHEALTNVDLLKGGTKLPKLGIILIKRIIEIELTQNRKEEWNKEEQTTFIIMKYS